MRHFVPVLAVALAASLLLTQLPAANAAQADNAVAGTTTVS